MITVNLKHIKPPKEDGKDTVISYPPPLGGLTYCNYKTR